MDHPIVEFVRTKGQSTAKELLDNIDLPERTLFRDLERLVEDGQLIKIGSRPNVIYKLPEVIQSAPTSPEVSVPAPQLDSETPSTSASATSTEPKPYPSPVIYWCKFLLLEPEAVRVSFQQIRVLVPNYQSMGLNPPKAKKVGLKVPDPIWIRFFNMLVWIVAFEWTMIKNCYAIVRRRTTAPVIWRQMGIVVISLLILLKLIAQAFVNPLTSFEYVQLKKDYELASNELDRSRGDLSRAQDELRSLQRQVNQSPSQDQIDDLKDRLQEEQKTRKALEKQKEDWDSKQDALQEETRKRERLESRVQGMEQESNARIEEWQKKERTYEKKLDASKVEIRELETELNKSTQETRQLTRQLQREQAAKKELEGEVEGLRRVAP